MWIYLSLAIFPEVFLGTDRSGLNILRTVNTVVAIMDSQLTEQPNHHRIIFQITGALAKRASSLS